jgi:hypothetical protein
LPRVSGARLVRLHLLRDLHRRSVVYVQISGVSSAGPDSQRALSPSGRNHQDPGKIIPFRGARPIRSHRPHARI